MEVLYTEKWKRLGQRKISFERQTTVKIFKTEQKKLLLIKRLAQTFFSLRQTRKTLVSSVFSIASNFRSVLTIISVFWVTNKIFPWPKRFYFSVYGACVCCLKGQNFHRKKYQALLFHFVKFPKTKTYDISGIFVGLQFYISRFEEIL
jgi:hypothetical protein